MVWRPTSISGIRCFSISFVSIPMYWRHFVKSLTVMCYFALESNRQYRFTSALDSGS